MRYCARCNQLRTSPQLHRGVCGACRRHRCTVHPRGAAVCYKVHRCRCDDCLRAESVRSKLARHAAATGHSAMVPAGPVREHLVGLARSGMGRAEIERRSGVSRTTLLRILEGSVARVARRTSTAVLRATPAPIAEQPVGRVDAAGTGRRLWALMAIGWSQRELARRLGTSPSQVERLRRHPTCTAEMRARVAGLYSELWDEKPAENRRHSANRARNLAAAHGSPTPLGWDDGTGPHGIDNPAATPCVGRAEGQRPPGELLREVEFLIGSASAESIAARLGFTNADSLATCVARIDRGLADRLRTTRERAA